LICDVNYGLFEFEVESRIVVNEALLFIIIEITENLKKDTRDADIYTREKEKQETGRTEGSR
jgi:hypothetical protein